MTNDNVIQISMNVALRSLNTEDSNSQRVFIQVDKKWKT